MKLENLIGENVARAREAAGLSLSELGEKLAAYVGDPWPRQTVWQAENGKRRFTAAELVALADVLDVTIPWLLRPDHPLVPVDVGEKRIPRGALHKLTASGSSDPADVAFAEVAHDLRRFTADLADQVDAFQMLFERATKARERAKTRGR